MNNPEFSENMLKLMALLCIEITKISKSRKESIGLLEIANYAMIAEFRNFYDKHPNFHDNQENV